MLERLLQRSDQQRAILCFRIAKSLQEIETHRDTAFWIGPATLSLRSVGDESVGFVPPDFADVRVSQQEAQGDIASKPSGKTRNYF